jgi:hypothetical protein
MATSGVDIVYTDFHDEVEEHLQGCSDALMANMDGLENEKKQQLEIITETSKTFYVSVFFLHSSYLHIVFE